MDIKVTVNGLPFSSDVAPRTLFVDFLRDELRLTGTHIGCEDGKCGACTVLLNGEEVKSCMLLAVQTDGADITTIEGLAEGAQLHPVQTAFLEQHGLQCGYCTPGFVVAAIGLLRRNPDPSPEEIRAELVGNLCRCTGYTNVVEAVRAAAQAVSANGEVANR